MLAERGIEVGVRAAQEPSPTSVARLGPRKSPSCGSRHHSATVSTSTSVSIPRLLRAAWGRAHPVRGGE